MASKTSRRTRCGAEGGAARALVLGGGAEPTVDVGEPLLLPPLQPAAARASRAMTSDRLRKLISSLPRTAPCAGSSSHRAAAEGTAQDPLDARTSTGASPG